MSLTIFALPDKPHDFPVRRTAETWEQCAFLLDFTRPLQKQRQLFGKVLPFGIPALLFVPIVYGGEDKGGFVFGVNRGQPYFIDIMKLWKKHRGQARTLKTEPQGGFNILAAMATHFPEDVS